MAAAPPAAPDSDESDYDESGWWQRPWTMDRFDSDEHSRRSWIIQEHGLSFTLSFCDSGGFMHIALKPHGDSFCHLLTTEALAWYASVGWPYHISIGTCRSSFQRKLWNSFKMAWREWDGDRRPYWFPVSRLSGTCAILGHTFILQDRRLLLLHRRSEYKNRQLHVSM